jgi:hypothetical protein
MKKRSLVLVVLVISLFLLVSCKKDPNAGQNPRDTVSLLRQVQSGTQGIELEVLPNYPPDTVYDENELIIITEVKNKGNDALDAQECFVEIVGHDPSIVTGYFGPESCADSSGVLEGKTIYNLDGGFNQIEFESSDVRLPLGVFEYTPTLDIKTCYLYTTTASPQVCLDPLSIQVSREQTTCDWRKGVSVSAGQGGPVSISYVGIDMIGSGKAFVEINIANSNGGAVLGNDVDIRSCGNLPLHHTDLDRVGYEVFMTGADVVSCNPSTGFVRLVNGQGKITCKINIPHGPAFETPLTIQLDYGYMKSQKKPLRIIATPE